MHGFSTDPTIDERTSNVLETEQVASGESGCRVYPETSELSVELTSRKAERPGGTALVEPGLLERSLDCGPLHVRE